MQSVASLGCKNCAKSTMTWFQWWGDLRGSRHKKWKRFESFISRHVLGERKPVVWNQVIKWIFLFSAAGLSLEYRLDLTLPFSILLELFPTWQHAAPQMNSPPRLLIGTERRGWLAASVTLVQPDAGWVCNSDLECRKERKHTLYHDAVVQSVFQSRWKKTRSLLTHSWKCNLKTECNGVIKQQRLQMGGRKTMKRSNGSVSWRRREIAATLTKLMCTPQWQ